MSETWSGALLDPWGQILPGELHPDLSDSMKGRLELGQRSCVMEDVEGLGL